jgi:2-oxoglutarate ferredoxin oxidoreductase subunit beta
VKLGRKDFQSDQEVRWCPGCGDYSILAAMQLELADIGVRPENLVFVSGIGCAARFPYYMNTYGLHSIHGRAPAVATGVALARPDLDVWVIGGDGDMLSIGGNHLIHALRRNVGIKIVMFNNRIYGLTKGQYSPTSEIGKRTPSTPLGSVDYPFNPISLALGADATFVARSVDTYREHLTDVLEQAARHPGSAFVEIYQNCNIFNDDAFAYMTEKEIRDDNQVVLRPGKPLLFGANLDRGIRRKTGGRGLEVVTLGEGVSESDLLAHDATTDNPAFAFELSRMEPPDFPTPIGVFRSVPRESLESGIWAQVDRAKKKAGDQPSLDALLTKAETWTVR